MARMEKAQLLRPVIGGLALLSLTACMSSGSGGLGAPGFTSAMAQTAGISAAVQDTSVLTADLDRSCAELDQMSANLYARAETIQNEARAQERQNAFLGGIANAAIGIVGSRGMFGAGSIEGIEAAQTATHLAQTATSAALTDDSGSLEQITSTSAIVQRVRQVEAAKLQNGC